MSTTTQAMSGNQIAEFDVVKEFGQGRYSAAMAELYADAKRLLALSHIQALKLSKAFGAELGRHHATSSITFGKKTKDGKMTLRDTATMKGVTVTFAISIAKLCVILQEARTYGVTDCNVELREDYLEWLNS